jgi:hypothetical protein
LVYVGRVAAVNTALAAFLWLAAALARPWWQPASTWRNLALLAVVGTIAAAITLAGYRRLTVTGGSKPGARRRT